MRARLALPLLVALIPSLAYADVNCDYVDKKHALVANGFKTVEFTLCEDHFAFGTGAYDDAMAIFDDFNRVQNSEIQMVFAGWAAHTNYEDTRTKNGINKIDFTEAGCVGDDCSFSGRAKPWNNVWGRVKECDVVLNENSTWRFGLPASNQRSLGGWLRNILTHEIGHCIGWPHSKSTVDVPNIMGSGTGKWLQEDETDVHMGLKAFDHGHLRHHYSDGGDDGRPDLLFTNWTVDASNACVENEQISDTNAGYGQSIELSWTRQNTGPVSNGSCFYTELILSTDRVIGNADDILADRWRVCTAVPESSTTFHDRTITIDPSWPEALYNVAMNIDADDDVNEADETNNLHFLAEQLTVEAQPDLITEITGKMIMMQYNPWTFEIAGRTLSSVSVEVRNDGYGDAPATEVELGRDGSSIATLAVPALTAGDSWAGTFSGIGQDLQDHRYWWSAEVDPGRSIEETSEANNDDGFETNYRTPTLPDDDIIIIDEPEVADRLDPLP
jgi:hypothetical protein